ncbi:MAG: leucine-rich repeat protein [Verrucomicrobia bacterium]|nr:leucine-rich repeat protein [Verrucomicrobiota bacterium]
MTTNHRQQLIVRPLPAVIPATSGADLKMPVPGNSRWLKQLTILCCMVNAVSADTFGLFTYTDNGTSITITDYPDNAVGAVEIPASITGKPVTIIGDYAFNCCSWLTSVSIPTSVTSIGYAAFYLCGGLTSVSIPTGVTSIGDIAFYLCGGLASVSIPTGVTSIGYAAFYLCSGLTSVTIPSSVTIIGDAAFHHCSSLKSAVFLGNAPSQMGTVVFGFTASGFAVYYLDGMTGFTTPTWLDYPAFSGESPQFTSAAPPSTGRVGVAYNHTCTATGVPPPIFSVTSGALPTGLIMTSDGVISGTPIVRSTFTGTITATSGPFPAATQGFSIDTNEYQVLSTGGANGTVTGGGTYPLHATATLTARQNPGYVFTGWTGDITGTVNPLSVFMDTNKTITANFVPDTTDGDTDGLSTYLEAVVYGTNPALPDTDGDGLTDGWEVGLGRFSIIAGSFTWAQARADAHTRGGELACFPTADRWNRAMESLGANALDPYTGLWIGASDAATEGAWTWVNGETFAFQQWATSRPSTTPGNTLDHVEVSGGGGAEIGKWYDRSPTTLRDGYILETGYATDPLVADADGDGLNDGAEQAAGSNPFLPDTDGDGLTDAQEVNLTHTNPKLADSNGNGTSDAQEDSDGDSLTNLTEVTQHGTDPLVDDSDADGIKDGAEINHAGSFYQLVPGSFTYPQAVADVAAKRGRVAGFPNAADYSRLAAKARQTTPGYLWIGLSDAATEGTWAVEQRQRRNLLPLAGRRTQRRSSRESCRHHGELHPVGGCSGKPCCRRLPLRAGRSRSAGSGHRCRWPHRRPGSDHHPHQPAAGRHRWRRPVGWRGSQYL